MICAPRRARPRLRRLWSPATARRRVAPDRAGRTHCADRPQRHRQVDAAADRRWTLEPDRGSVWRQPGIRISRLVQDVPLSATKPVFDVVAEGLGDLAALVTEYHHAAVEVAGDADAGGGSNGSAACSTTLEERDGWRLEQRVEWIVSRLDLPADAIVDTLSGGWRRRVLLARALVGQPDVAAARRADQPSRHRRDCVARGLSRRPTPAR